jgi:hypothetical protein
MDPTGKNSVMNYPKGPNWVSQPGPVLKRATMGKYKKGKRPKMIPSAAQVAEVLARAWGPN